jgi:hypothetical protein
VKHTVFANLFFFSSGNLRNRPFNRFLYFMAQATQSGVRRCIRDHIARKKCLGLSSPKYPKIVGSLWEIPAETKRSNSFPKVRQTKRFNGWRIQNRVKKSIGNNFCFGCPLATEIGIPPFAAIEKALVEFKNG